MFIEAEDPFAASGSNWWPHFLRSGIAPGAEAVWPEDLDTNNRVWVSMKQVDCDAARMNYFVSPRPGAPSERAPVAAVASFCAARSVRGHCVVTSADPLIHGR